MQIVVTSRIPLDLDGEVLVTVEPLACPTRRPARRRSGPHPPCNFCCSGWPTAPLSSGTDRQTAALLAAITRRLDGLPLALELAAGQAAGRSLADLAALVAAPLDVPASGRTRNTRHRSLRDTLQWSMNRLDRRSPNGAAPAQCVRRPLRPGGRRGRGGADRRRRRDRPFAGPGRADPCRARQRRPTQLPIAQDGARTGGGGSDPDELAATQALHRLCLAGRRQVDSVDLVENVRGRLDDYLEALRTALASRDASTLADLTFILSQFWQFVDGQGPGLRWIGRVLDSDVLSPDERPACWSSGRPWRCTTTRTWCWPTPRWPSHLLDGSGRNAHDGHRALHPGLGAVRQGRGDEASMHADRAVAIARDGAVSQLATALGTAALIHAVNERADAAMRPSTEARAYLDVIEAPPTGSAPAASLALALVNLERFDAALDLLDSVGGTVTARGGQRSDAVPADPRLGGIGCRRLTWR